MEILLGLQGFTGDVVVEKKGTLEIVADFVNVSEKELLNRLVSLGNSHVIIFLDRLHCVAL